ncbi:hypothetical protein [Acetivibrio cellulolyticus]|uniref:hypothetical protein n=1 Tax=Acetivibrio cellulolyticus TaxID=35830 RepID=UPI0001E2D1B5|nr:hypothetical protein [Acetivibrio cellulolyticus]
MKKLSRSNIIAFLIGLVIVNVVFICLRPFFSFNIFSYDFIMHSLIAVSVSIFPWGIYYIVNQESEGLKSE